MTGINFTGLFLIRAIKQCHIKFKAAIGDPPDPFLPYPNTKEEKWSGYETSVQ